MKPSNKLRETINGIIVNSAIGIEEFACTCKNCSETRNIAVDKLLSIFSSEMEKERNEILKEIDNRILTIKWLWTKEEDKLFMVLKQIYLLRETLLKQK